MGREHTLGGKSFILPPAFFDQIMQDIPVATWVRLVESNPSLKEILLEGFSARPHKLAALMKQPRVLARLRRFLQSERAPLEEILDIWGQEQLPVVAFLEMLDGTFLEDNWESIKDFLGPERFFAALFVLGNLEESGVEKRVGEEFWERHVEPDLVEILIPVWSLWREFVGQYPEAREWLEGFGPPQPTGRKNETGKSDQRPCDQSRREEERRRKIQQKLEKAREEQTHLQEQLARYKKDNEELRKRVAEWVSSFDNRVEEAVDHYRKDRFQRYQQVDERPLEEAHGRMEMLLKRADRAFELQRQADEQYGLISSVRQKLIQVELYLKEIERIYADSLVVHAEVAKVKDGLLQERQRLLRLPGIEKVLPPESAPEVTLGLRKRIRLMAAVPENLPKITKVENLVARLATLGFIEDPEPLKEDIRIKKRQILETLYACFPSPIRAFSSSRAFRSFDDFVLSGRSKDYDMYIDGYNILLQVQGGKKIVGSSSMAPFREGFIEAVHEKSHLFRKVYLVFDGIEDSRDRRANLEIIYTDKTRGNTADSIIIQALKKRNDNKALLVTSDQEIIKATESRVFAMVDPRHFYTFVFDVNFM
jgi:F0F1-type ATP synthase membrane subunit b/b'